MTLTEEILITLIYFFIHCGRENELNRNFGPHLKNNSILFFFLLFYVSKITKFKPIQPKTFILSF